MPVAFAFVDSDPDSPPPRSRLLRATRARRGRFAALNVALLSLGAEFLTALARSSCVGFFCWLGAASAPAAGVAGGSVAPNALTPTGALLPVGASQRAGNPPANFPAATIAKPHFIGKAGGLAEPRTVRPLRPFAGRTSAAHAMANLPTASAERSKASAPRALRNDLKVAAASDGKLTVNFGGNDSVSAAAPSAFGFLPAKTAPPFPAKAPLPPPLARPASIAVPRALQPSAGPFASSLSARPVPLARTAAAPARFAPRAAALPASQGVVLDQSLGNKGQPSISLKQGGITDYAVNENNGTTAGNNLFFSFAQFDLRDTESATFNGPASIQNIIARVTGAGASSIDGPINVTIDGANLFLINRAGFMFGPGAILNLPGSFVATTADSLTFLHGASFGAQPGAGDAMLSDETVSAFHFEKSKDGPAPVMFNGSQIKTATGADLFVVAGTQTIDGASLSAPAGRVNLVSVTSAGDVPAVPSLLRPTPLTAPAKFGTVTIQNSGNVSSDSGRVEIDARTLNVLDSSQIGAVSLPTAMPNTPGGTIVVRAQSLLVSNSSSIQAQNLGAGPGGMIEIQAHDVVLSNGGSPANPSQIQTSTFGHGNGGSINVAAETVRLDGSVIEASSGGPGAAGNVAVKANQLSITGSASFVASGILAESGDPSPGGQNVTGPGGNIQVVAQDVILRGGGEISATTFAPGQGGNVAVSANTVTISGFSLAKSPQAGVAPTIFQSGILSQSLLAGAKGAGGDGGDVMVSTGRLSILANGLIASSTAGNGRSGNVAITAGAIVTDGTGATLPTGIVATTDFVTGGRGGGITIAAGSLQVLGGAEISAATAGTGTGGNVAVTGGNVLISGPRSIIDARTTALEGGAGGDLQFKVNTLSVLAGAQLSASTQGSGRGGAITIAADQVNVADNAAIAAGTSGRNATVTHQPAIADVSFEISIQSTANALLDLALYDPAGLQVSLFKKGTAGGANLTDTTFSDQGAAPIDGNGAPYSGIFQPSTPFAVLGQGTANGTWKLIIANSRPAVNPATLEMASLTVNGQQVADLRVPLVIPARRTITVPLNLALPVTQAQVQAGAGGSVQINAGTIDVRSGGTVSASTSGDGAAGSLALHAKTITIDATGAAADTGFLASTLASSTGRGGSISISTDALSVLGSSHSGVAGGVVARSVTAASAGDITVQAGHIALDAGAVVSSANLGSGPAGSVSLTASDSIVLQNGSVVTVVARSADAGTISLEAGGNVELHGGSTITASAGAGGGSVMIHAGNQFILDRSSIAATAGNGMGGNITIDPLFIILDRGLVSANAAAGAGGNILIEGQYFFNNESALTATGTTAGTVQISTLPLDLVNALAALQGGFIDLSSALQESCTMRLGVDASSFLVLGRGGVEASPDEPQEEIAGRMRPNATGKARGR